jgi:hypothetical protein
MWDGTHDNAARQKEATMDSESITLSFEQLLVFRDALALRKKALESEYRFQEENIGAISSNIIKGLAECSDGIEKVSGALVAVRCRLSQAK